MIICPICSKRITTIPGKTLDISCTTCKTKMIVDSNILVSHRFKADHSNKFYYLAFYHSPDKEFRLFLDGASILHMNNHPKVTPETANAWIDRIMNLKAFL